MLYEYLTLNTADFKTSRYVKFTTATGDFSNISIYSNNLYTPKFYKLKLFHQLNNGYVDLTDDIWKKYIAWSTKSSNHWCGDTSFRYYCPSQYKGRLVSSIQMEDLYKFQLYNIPIWQLNNTGDYDLSLKIDHSLKVNIVPTNGCIKIVRIKFAYTIDNVTVETLTEATISNIYGNISVTPINITIPAINLGKVLEYKITPVIGITGSTLTYDTELPNEFLENYTLKGRTRISTDFDGAEFIPMLNNTICDLAKGTKINNEYVFADENGNYLDPFYNVTTVPHVFIRNGYTPQSGATIIGTYDVIDFKPKLNTPWLTIVDTVVLNMFEQIIVEVSDPNCIEVINSIDLTLNFNDLSEDTTIEVLQTGYPNYNLIGFNDAPATLTFSIVKNVNTTIHINRDGFNSVTISNPGFTSNTSLNIAMVANVGWYDTMYQDGSFDYEIRWDTTSIVPEDLSLSYFIGTEPYPTGSSISLYYWLGVGYSSGTSGWQGGNPAIISRSLENGASLSLSYYNIADPTNYTMIGNIIFSKQI